ncbi:Rossmann-like and DUF2520 domain-containing protein [Maribacter sp. 2307ULW6-5]|uniref:Rossmann-like and DUF2520 domain-containing protein n=1 Tax=Maribacter sp. 2307ULW6-5 TaxID=3386275 RepID=UPI0039BC8876
MRSMVLVGTGNLARILYDELSKIDSFTIKQVVGRSHEKLSHFSKDTPTTTTFDHLEVADVYLMAVADKAIPLVADQMAQLGGLLVHTSGATDLNALGPAGRKGVFYPLQTFTHGTTVNFRQVPIGVEAENNEDTQLLHDLGRSLSDTVFDLPSPKRAQLHLAAVFANNFTNYLYSVAADICRKQELNFSLLLPLIQQTAKKVGEVPPERAQTGPAIRNDLKTMHAHLNLLQKKEHKDLYILLSNAIKASHGEKL